MEISWPLVVVLSVVSSSCGAIAGFFTAGTLAARRVAGTRRPERSTAWPVAALLSIVFSGLTFLAWKGLVSSHIVSFLGGSIVGFLIARKSAPPDPRPSSGESFSAEEPPTDRTDAARTARIEAMTREELERRSK